MASWKLVRNPSAIVSGGPIAIEPVRAIWLNRRKLMDGRIPAMNIKLIDPHDASKDMLLMLGIDNRSVISPLQMKGTGDGPLKKMDSPDGNTVKVPT